MNAAEKLVQSDQAFEAGNTLEGAILAAQGGDFRHVAALIVDHLRKNWPRARTRRLDVETIVEGFEQHVKALNSERTDIHTVFTRMRGGERKYPKSKVSVAADEIIISTRLPTDAQPVNYYWEVRVYRGYGGARIRTRILNKLGTISTYE